MQKKSCSLREKNQGQKVELYILLGVWGLRMKEYLFI